jgi:hypothetical protein
MAQLTPVIVTNQGVNPAPVAAAAGGDKFKNTGRQYVRIRNSSGSNAYTVTFVTAGTVKGIAIADVAVSVPAGVGTTRVVGPFDEGVFNDSNGDVSITYSGSAPATDLLVDVTQV